MKELTPELLRGVLDRAIVLCDSYTPLKLRAGEVREMAIAILVAGRALVEALIEHNNAPETGT